MAGTGPGRKPLGPYSDEPMPALAIEDISALQTSLSVMVDDFRVTVPAEELSGRLGPFNTRARIILVHLLKGYSRGMAATQAGVSESALENWEKAQPAFREATVWAHQTGFRRTFEPELYRRAMAGSEDKGSMRALELVTKQRDASYRERSQVQMEIVTRAIDATQQLASGWKEAAAPDAQ